MIIAKPFHFFLCAGLVTCMGPSYDRNIDELFNVEFEDALHPHDDGQPWWDGYFEDHPPSVKIRTEDPSVKIRTEIPPPSVKIYTEIPPPSLEIATHNPPQSSQANDIVFVKQIKGSDPNLNRVSHLVQLRTQVDSFFGAHVSHCSIGGARKVVFENQFKHLHSGEPINRVQAYVFAIKGRLIVRVKDATRSFALKKQRLLPAVKEVFESFYTQMDDQLRARSVSEEGRLSIFNGAANWLLKILTTHDESLPVIGIVKPETNPEDYKFGKHQLSLIEVICKVNRGEEVHAVAQGLVKDYLASHQAPNM